MNLSSFFGSTAGLRLLAVGISSPVVACLLSWLVCRLRTRASAAARHLIWILAFVAMAVCVPITLLNVRVTLPILAAASARPIGSATPLAAPIAIPEGHGDVAAPASDSAPTESAGALAPVQHSAANVRRGMAWPQLLVGVWALGFLYLLAAFMAGSFRLRGILSRSRVAEDPRLVDEWSNLPSTPSRKAHVRLLMSSEVRVPLVGGLWRPVVILPDAARQWSAQMLRAALIHELAHLERRDLLCSAFARLVASFYWFNPAAWYGLRCLHAEAEMAADDRVVVEEAHPAEYAESLVTLMRDLRGNQAALFPAIGMLRGRGIEARLCRILDPNPRRLAPRRLVRWAALAGAVVVSAGVLMIRLVAAAPLPIDEKKAIAAANPASENVKEALLLAANIGDGVKIRQVLQHNRSLGADGIKEVLDELLVARKLSALGALLSAFDETGFRRSWQPSEEILTSLAREERKDFIDLLLAHGVKPEGMEAAVSGASDSMQAWLKGRVTETRQQREIIDSLVKAAGEGDLAALRRLLDAGVNVNGVAGDDWTPLTKAAQKNQLPAVQLLLERGAKVDQPRLPGWDYTALCLTKSVEIAGALKKAGADVHAKLYRRQVSILTYVARWADADLVQWFLDQGLDPKMIGDNDQTLLFDAGNVKIMELLLSRGVDPNRPDEGGNTPLMSAQDAGSTKTLLAHGARITGLKWPILPAMVNSASVDAIGVVLEAGAGKDTVMLQSALVNCANGDKDEMARLLLKYGAKPNEAASPYPDASHKMLPLLACGVSGATKTARVLLENGADPNAGESPGAFVREALSHGHPEVATILREAGVRGVSDLANAVGANDGAKTAALLETAPTYQNDPGFWSDVLPNAARLGDIKTVQAALARGVPPRHDKEDAFEAAASEGHYEVLEILLATRTETANPDEFRPALNAAISNSTPRANQRPAEAFEKTVKMLLKAKTPLLVNGHNNLVFRAVFTRRGGGNAKVIQMLVDAGADPNPDGFTLPDGRVMHLLDALKESNGGGRPMFNISPECVGLLQKLAAVAPARKEGPSSKD